MYESLHRGAVRSHNNVVEGKLTQVATPASMDTSPMIGGTRGTITEMNYLVSTIENLLYGSLSQLYPFGASSLAIVSGTLEAPGHVLASHFSHEAKPFQRVNDHSNGLIYRGRTCA